FFIHNDRLPYLGINLELDPRTQAENWIQIQLKRYQSNGLGHLAVEADGSFIGVGGIIPRVINGAQEYEIAYSLIPKFWKQGYGTELAMQMKWYAFKYIKTKRLISIIHKKNIDSIHVAKKNGMSLLYEMEYLGMEVYVFGINR
ncbi:MAG: GNAT family N-acetyltransferase, partial [Bacteroidota bacterium]